ncbi:hypothetical protein J437_LFUL004583 [Ladona fulva]|uniref:Protein kinase domain-containing protein n=1 Tax=Ladona fulva TaxID=123851 RepID=A0A8K0NUW2_LADFU|nr:hypothetical protein J437_LFUL004583 [Ladona fulva]
MMCLHVRLSLSSFYLIGMKRNKNGGESPGSSHSNSGTETKAECNSNKDHLNEAERKEEPEFSQKKLTILKSHGYIIGQSIGNGSYATVKLAFSEKHQSNVAVKIVSKKQAPADYLRKFLPRELEVVKGLRHKNIIRFLQAIETTHRVYIIMEFAVNGNLLEIIRRELNIDETRAKKWFKQMSEAVEYCHKNGVTHRDIKCENLLIDGENNIKLTDFGFSRKMPQQKSFLSETFCGSYAYASPEILRGIPYHPVLADIWSMGVVLFAMVFGRLPFDDSNYNVLLKQVQKKVRFPKQPTVSTRCRALITQILAPYRVRIHMPGILDDPWLQEEVMRSASEPESDAEKSGSETVTSDTDAVPVQLITKDILKSAAGSTSKNATAASMGKECTDEDTGVTEAEESIQDTKGRETDSESSDQT